MTSTEEKVETKKSTQTSIKEAGGVHGWLLKKAKTFMWDSASNTLILPKGVILSKEEREALEEVIGAIKDEAAEFDKRRQMQISAMQQAGIKYKSNYFKEYTLLMSGSYRELTGVVALKIHNNLQNMLMVNKRFVSGIWKVLSGLLNNETQKQQKPNIKFQTKNRER